VGQLEKVSAGSNRRPEKRLWMATVDLSEGVIVSYSSCVFNHQADLREHIHMRLEHELVR
jgi:hypothetical protein